MKVVKATSSVQYDMQMVSELVGPHYMAFPLKACQQCVVVDSRGKREEKLAPDGLAPDHPMWSAVGW